MRTTPNVRIYGIKNCDTMKKAMAWLTGQGIVFEFIDYKKAGVVADRLPHWLALSDWTTLLNRRGLMWKKLAEAERADVDGAKAATLMRSCPALIKRPVLEIDDRLLVGFDADTYARHFIKD